MAKTENPVTYRVVINDYYTAPERCKRIELDIDYLTLEEAAMAGWAIVEAFAAVHDLGCENQGDQFMAYYDSGEHEGWGVLTVEIFDSESEHQEDL